MEIEKMDVNLVVNMRQKRNTWQARPEVPSGSVVEYLTGLQKIVGSIPVWLRCFFFFSCL